MNVGFYLILFQHAPSIGAATGWGRAEFFIFLATTWMINAIVQTFFMPNAQEFSELIRTGGLDFALLKPIDTQFLISFRRMDWSALSNLVVAVLLLGVGMYQLSQRSDPTWQPGPWVVILYPFYLFCGVAILYSIMTVLAATSIWLGRNQSLYDFWFYITNFSRYPAEIYQRGWGYALWGIFTFAIPVLVVVNGAASSAARLLGASDGSVRRSCCFRQPVCQSTDFPAGAGQLPKRQQLTDRIGTSRGDWHPARRALGIPNRGTSSARG
jgi:ABC-2 type transport system permease protein